MRRVQRRAKKNIISADYILRQSFWRNVVSAASSIFPEVTY
jgi:hypothetical protein